MNPHRVGVLVAGALWLHPARVEAAPLGSWCLGLERLFGMSWASNSFDREYGETFVERRSVVNVLAAPAASQGYSAPRLGLDYVTPLGLSAGAALGVDAFTRRGSVSFTDDPNAIAFVLAPRLGYFFQPVPWLGLWPRLGFTYLGLTRDDDHQAVTLDLPVSLLVAEERLGLMLVPYFEAGLPEDGGDKLVEGGLLFSVGLFL